MSCLAPCPACDRHVSTDETACPFCAAALPETFRCQPTRVQTAGRMSRAAMIAAGAALMGASCGNSVRPPYGIAVVPDASADTSTNDSSAVPIYGAAPAPLEQTPPAADSAPPPGRNEN